MKRLIVILVFAALVLAACAQPPTEMTAIPDSALLGTMVAETLTAVAPQATATAAPSETPAQPAASPTSAQAEVTGKVCYPPDGDQPFTLFFENTSNSKVTQVAISASVLSFSAFLEPGTYKVYMWLTDFSRSGLACNGENCNVDKPLTFTWSAGQKATGVDLCDWYNGPFDVPYPPGYAPEKTVGSVSGSIVGYPGSSNASVTVVAFNQETGNWYYFTTNPGGRYYSIENLPPGTYQLVAYGEGYKGGTLQTVVVKSGGNTTADITDWSGSYPDDPR